MITSQSPDSSMSSPQAQDAIDDQNIFNKDQDTKEDPVAKKRNDEFRQRVELCKLYRRKLIANWTVNIDYRRGKPFSSQTDQDQIAVNIDWSMTKSKQAALFSQVPQIRLDHSPDTLPQIAPWATKFEAKLNQLLVESGIESAMDEALPDCINAAGFGAILVSYESITESRKVPKHDTSDMTDDEVTSAVSSGTHQGQPFETDDVPYVTDHRYVTQRLSPSDLLWPINFTGVNFDRAPWVGRSGRVTWADAVQKFRLTEADKSNVLGEDRPMMDKLTHDVERDRSKADEMVGFDELFYKEYEYFEDSKTYSAIHHLVFVNGKDEPVIDEPWKGQQVSSDGSLVGSTKFPIRVLTLTYITDETIPPSDSAIARPQVDEINKGRTQMIKQRERSLPIRTFDVNRLDPAVQQSLMRGVWQAMIPVQGDGSRVITEVTRASMPQENFMFDKIAKADLLEQFGAMSAIQQEEMDNGDPNQVKSNFNTRIGRERARVAAFFTGVAQILGSLMCLYEDPSSFGQGFQPALGRLLNYAILPDSTVLLDTTQRLARLNQFVNLYAKSGFVNLLPVFQEIATLSGLDPTLVIKQPSPKPPVEPNISLRLTGVEDMLNPLALAFLIKSGQAPPAPMIEQAKALIQQAVTPPQGLQMPSTPMAPGGFPMVPQGQAPPGAPIPPPVGAPPPGTPLPAPHPPLPGGAHPQMSALEAIDKRSEPGGRQ